MQVFENFLHTAEACMTNDGGIDLVEGLMFFAVVMLIAVLMRC